MSAVIEKPCVSLPIRLNISTPSWVKDFKNQETYTCYSREGMSDLRIARAYTKTKISEERHCEAKASLDHLLKLSSIPVSMEVFREVFKLVNGAISNSLSREIFNFKIKALYSIFADYPICIFTQETARKIAKLNIFFPSANEIESILNKAKRDLESEIENLKSIVGYDVYTNEDQLKEQQELKEKRRQHFQDKIDQERQIRINRLHAITKPIDDLLITIKEAVENYMPENYLEMSGSDLIQVFTDKIDIAQDEQIKAILQEKIDALRSREKQIEDLNKLGIVTIPTKKRATA